MPKFVWFKTPDGEITRMINPDLVAGLEEAPMAQNWTTILFSHGGQTQVQGRIRETVRTLMEPTSYRY